MTEFDPVAFLERAVATPSHENPDEMRSLLVETLADAGHEPTVDEYGNVLATRGEGSPHIVLNTHVDTVPPHVPFERDGDVIHGRGACDAKGPLAAFVAGFLRSDPAGKLSLVVTPDEETESLGIVGLDIDALNADGVIVGEPTGLNVATAARGRFDGTVTVRGESAHAASPEEGANAIDALGPVLDAIGSFDDASGPPPHPQLGEATLTPTLVEGGEAKNQVPAESAVRVDRRSVPPETADEFEAALDRHLRAHAPGDVTVGFELVDRVAPFFEAFETPTDAPLVETLRATSGGEVEPFGAATEASFFAPHAPTVVFGPGDLADDDGPVAHSEREYVRVHDVRTAADAVTETLNRLG